MSDFSSAQLFANIAVLKRQSRKLFSIFLKAAILVTAFGFIFHRLSDNTSIGEFNRLMKSLSIPSVLSTVSAVVALMLLNWLLEARKWQYVLRKIERLSFWQSVQSVFCGLTFAVFTPNRIGEYGARVLFLSPRRRVIGLVAMGLGAASQLIATHLTGSLAVLWFVNSFVKVHPIALTGLTVVAVFYALLLIVAFFNIKWLRRLIKGIKFTRKYERFFNILSTYDREELTNILLFSLARYLAFTLQYYLIINLLLPFIPALSVVMMIFLLFFVQSALPSIDIFDVGVRVFTASYFFSFLTDQEVAVMAAVAFIWMVNLIIPALMGSVVVLKLNFFDRTR